MTHAATRLLTRIDRAAGGLTADLFLYALSTAFAAATAATSTLQPHRAWGAIATWAYAAATAAVVVQLLFRVRRKALTRTAARAALTWTTWLAAALLPLIVEAIQRAAGRTDRAQEEVLVVERMGDRLLHAGTPYLSRDTIAALPADDRLMAYSPYQPGMAVFGLPRAVFGDFWWTDARVWFAAVTAAALITAVLLLRPSAPAAVRAVQAATVLPVCALTLATGGDDIPVLALCLLSLALIKKGRFGRAGAAVGAAAACKLFAFPVVAVLIVLAIARRSRRLPHIDHRRDPASAPATQQRTALNGLPPVTDPPTPAAEQDTALGSLPPATSAAEQGTALRRQASDLPPVAGPSAAGLDGKASDFPPVTGRSAPAMIDPQWSAAAATSSSRRLLPGAIGLPVLVLMAPLLVAGDALVENVLRFPLGHGLVTSPAQSPFPGYLLAQNAPGGRWVAVGLLLAVAATIGVRLIRRPPRTAAAAALICGWGLLAAILLMPTTRFGYLLYPIAFLVWAPALSEAPPRTADRSSTTQAFTSP